MANSPWECPRCNRMNAPWNPACICNKQEQDKTDQKREEAQLKIEQDKAKWLQEIEAKIVKRDTCKVCNRNHGGTFPCGYLEIV